MSAVLDKVHAAGGLATLFEQFRASRVKMFELPRVEDYLPQGGLGFVADFSPETSLFDIANLEIALEGLVGGKVLVMDYQDKSYFVSDEMLDQAEPV